LKKVRYVAENFEILFVCLCDFYLMKNFKKLCNSLSFSRTVLDIIVIASRSNYRFMLTGVVETSPVGNQSTTSPVNLSLEIPTK